MKNKNRKLKKIRAARRGYHLGQSVVGASLIALSAHVAKADKITPEQWFEGGTNTYNNWIELSTGSLMTSGNGQQAQSGQQLGSGVFGGIEDLHYQTGVTKNATLSIDGRGIYDNHDYNVGLSLVNTELGYVKVGFRDFRTWSAANGGYLPYDHQAFSLPGDVQTLDHGLITFEAGLTKGSLPKITFKYSHRYKNGNKASTIWGPVNDSGGNVRRVYPGLQGIDETSDTVQLDLSHYATIAKKTVNYKAGVAYEWGDYNNQDRLTFWDGSAFQQKATNKQGTTFGMLSAHAYAESWLKSNLYVSTGFSYDNLDDSFTGSRIYGDSFDVAYSPLYQAVGMGYNNLNGGAHKNEYVANINLMDMPAPTFKIIPSIRIQEEDWNANSAGVGTLYDPFAGQMVTQQFNDNSDRNALNVTESLNLRYTGVTNWVFSTTGEWTEGQGSLNEIGGLTQVNNFGPVPVNYSTDDSRLLQKYAVNARWYPFPLTSLDLGGYYKINKYNYNSTFDNTPNNLSTGNAYPGFITYQGFNTLDGSVRLTFHPLSQVTSVSRYEYQYSTIDTRPDPASGLSQVESSRMLTHVIGQNLSWVPLHWLALQGGFNYVLSTTKTPASDYTQSILNAQNNYWTVNFDADFVLDNKTDLNIGYFYYRSADGQNTIVDGVPLGSDQQQHSVTATLTRRITQNLRWNLKYAFTKYQDFASDGNFSYNSHLVYTSLQYRF